MAPDEFRFAFLGDIVGKTGRQAVTAIVPKLRDEHALDLVIANGENAAGGLGIDISTAGEILKAGVDIITTGNHIWKKKEIDGYLEKHPDKIIRPINFPPGAPGKGVVDWTAPDGFTVRVANLMGRVFMPDLLDCPFQAAEKFFAELPASVKCVVLDFHAEATSEKVAFGYHCDGRAALVVGTHTHVQTADEQLLPKGTAYITDVGMCGPVHSVIGVDAQAIVDRFLSSRPTRFEVAGGQGMVNAVVVTCDRASGKPKSIDRIRATS